MKTLMASILLLAAIDCFCQIDLRGTVKDASTGLVVSGAIIRLEGTELRDTSDFKGEFRISNRPSPLMPGRPHIRPTGSSPTCVRIFQLAQARKVAEYEVPSSADWQSWPQPPLPAGLYILEAKTAYSTTKRPFISLGGASVAAPRPIHPNAPGNPFLAKAGSIRIALTGSKAEYFPGRQGLDTLLKDGITVWLRRLRSFDGLWIGRTESQDTMMMAIEGDSLIYLRGPDSLVTEGCTIRRLFQVPSTFLAVGTSGHASRDSIVGGVRFEYPGGHYKFDLAAGFATDSTAAGKMDIDVEIPSESANGTSCAGSRHMAWTAAKTRFDTRFDGSWKGMDSKGDSLRFEVRNGRLNAYSFDFQSGSASCGSLSSFGTTGFPYWVLPDGRFSVLRMNEESTTTFTYRMDGRFTGAMSATGVSHYRYSNSPPGDPPCEISDSTTWMADRVP